MFVSVRRVSIYMLLHIFDLGDPSASIDPSSGQITTSANEFGGTEEGKKRLIGEAFASMNTVVSYHNLAVWDREGVEWITPWQNANPLLFGTKTVPSIMEALGHKSRRFRLFIYCYSGGIREGT